MAAIGGNRRGCRMALRVAGSALALHLLSCLGGAGVSFSALPPRAPAAQDQELELSRRSAVLPGALAAFMAALGEGAEPALAEVDVPDRVTTDPYQLIEMKNPEDRKEDRKEFYMKKKYFEDTYQVVKHMKISASLDKGTPNMEKYNRRVKEEMDDWLALYRSSDLVVGRQSYYSLYSAINTLASHFTSYGPKFPFPSKRRPRFYELIATTEKYLEKNK